MTENEKLHYVTSRLPEPFYYQDKDSLSFLEQLVAIDSQTQRLFFGGKLLRKLSLPKKNIIYYIFLGDRTAVCETRLQRNFVVQVILQDQFRSS